MGDSPAIVHFTGTSNLDELFRMAQVGKCMDGVAHDLNNYIGSVLAYNELISTEDGVDPELRRMLNECAGALRKATQLVATMTILARPLRDSVVHGEVGPLAGHVFAMRQYDMRVHNVHGRFSSEGETGTVTMNQTRIAMALVHLLTNSVDAIGDAARREIVLTVSGHSDHVEVSVWDSRPPIGPAERASMFESGSTSIGEACLAFGLVHARRYAEEHGGTLEYDATRGFLLRLPKC